MRLGDRPIVLEIGGPIGNFPIELFTSRVDLGEHGGGGQKLERAAHRKTFIAAMRDRQAACGVEDENAEAAARACLQCGDPIAGGFHRIGGDGIGGAGGERREEDGETGEEGATMG